MREGEDPTAISHLSFPPTHLHQPSATNLPSLQKLGLPLKAHVKHQRVFNNVCNTGPCCRSPAGAGPARGWARPAPPRYTLLPSPHPRPSPSPPPPPPAGAGPARAAAAQGQASGRLRQRVGQVRVLGRKVRRAGLQVVCSTCGRHVGEVGPRVEGHMWPKAPAAAAGQARGPGLEAWPGPGVPPGPRGRC